MQTFMPFPSFSGSIRVLDNKRLGKQRVEAWQIYQALTVPDYGWKNHPAVKMWRGYELALVIYGLRCCAEWEHRGFVDNMATRFRDAFKRMATDNHDALVTSPPWMGNHLFHQSHRSNLLRKDPEHYKDLFEPGLPDDLPYVWPPETIDHRDWPLKIHHHSKAKIKMKGLNV